MRLTVLFLFAFCGCHHFPVETDTTKPRSYKIDIKRYVDVIERARDPTIDFFEEVLPLLDSRTRRILADKLPLAMDAVQSIKFTLIDIQNGLSSALQGAIARLITALAELNNLYNLIQNGVHPPYELKKLLTLVRFILPTSDFTARPGAEIDVTQYKHTDYQKWGLYLRTQENR